MSRAGRASSGPPESTPPATSPPTPLSSPGKTSHQSILICQLQLVPGSRTCVV
jgi:hypothetical protein